MTPFRVQRQRRKGWRMPPNTVYVGRPSKWENPCRVDHPDQLAHALAWYAARVLPTLPVDELKGFNLACWCPLDQPCHADLLLRAANGPTRRLALRNLNRQGPRFL